MWKKELDLDWDKQEWMKRERERESQTESGEIEKVTSIRKNGKGREIKN